MPATPAAAEEQFEVEMDGFESIAGGAGYTVAETGNNTFTISGPAPTNPEAIGGTGFFETLADEGIETISVGGTSYTISEDGEISQGAADARAAILQTALAGQPINITVNIPYGNAGATTPVTYTFNFVITG